MTWVNAALAAYSAYNGGSMGGGGGGGGSAPANPATATAAAYGSGLDSSGWVVNFSGTTSAAYTKRQEPDMPASSSPPSLAFVPVQAGAEGTPAMAGGAVTFLMVGLLGLALWRSKRSNG